MSIKMRCSDYGYECDLVLDEELTMGLIGKLTSFRRSLKKVFSFKESFRFLTRFLNSNLFIRESYTRYA